MGDIGLLGTKVGGEDGYHVFIGGGFGKNQAVGRQIFSGVTANELPATIEKMLQRLSPPRAPARDVPAIFHAPRLERAAGRFSCRRRMNLEAMPPAKMSAPSARIAAWVAASIMQVENGRVAKVIGDKKHPANFGRLCSKGVTCAEPLAAPDRLASAFAAKFPHGKTPAMPMDDALAQTAARLQKIISQHGPDAVAFYVSGQLSMEAQYLAGKLAKGFLRTNNIDSNSRLCMSSAASGYKLSLGADGPPGSYQDIDRLDCALVIGSNMAECHPILFLRLLDRRKKQGAKIIVVDPRRTPTADKADLFLQIKPGTDLALLNGILHLLLEKAGNIDEKFISRTHRRLGGIACVAERLSAGTRRAFDRLARGRHSSRGEMDWRSAGIHDVLDDGLEPEHARHLADERHLQSASGHRKNLSSGQRAVFADRPAERDGRTRSRLLEPHVARPARGDGRGRPRRRGKNLGRSRRHHFSAARTRCRGAVSKSWKPAR